MAQKRNKTGIDFEKLICESYGLSHKSVNPRIRWSGKGKSNFNKIHSVNFNANLFKPDLEKSRFDKYDAIDSNGNKYEIKKYCKSFLSGWVVYSEPIFKIASRSTMSNVIKLFGGGDYEKSKSVYNQFVKDMVDNVGQEIIDRITKQIKGVYLLDGFVSTEDLEFRWSIRESWMGYNRLSIEFKLK